MFVDGSSSPPTLCSHGQEIALTLITMAGVPDVFITGENYCSNLYNQG